MTNSEQGQEGAFDSSISDVHEFLERARTVGGEDAVSVTRDGLAWMDRCGGQWTMGKGPVRGPLYLTVRDRFGQPVKLLAIDTDGGVSVNYKALCECSPYHRPSERLSLNHRLNEIEGISIDDDFAERCSWPKVRLEALRPLGARSAFFRVFDDVATQLARGSPA